MHTRETLKKRFDERLTHSAINYAIEINDARLVFGAGTVLARMTRDECGTSRLDLHADWQRVFSLLAAAGWHGLEWFFAEPEAEEKAKEIFENDKGRFGKIKVRHEPAWMQ